MNYKNLADVPGIKKIIPQMFVWHVTLRENRDTIFKFGLRPDKSEHNCVFANNHGKKITLFYPFCLEIYNDTFRNENLIKYDYWRIDTTLFDADWYIDPNMKNGPKEYMEDNQDYIATESRIPKYAMDLFEVLDVFYIKKMYVVVSGKDKIKGRNHSIALHGKENKEIKKEIAEYRKELNITNIYTRRYLYFNEEKEDFPLGARSEFIYRRDMFY